MKKREPIKYIAEEMTIRVRPADLPRLRFYYHSPKRICIFLAETLLPEVWFKDGSERLASIGFKTVKELGQFLLGQGAKQTPKPAPTRPYRSIYD